MWWLKFFKARRKRKVIGSITHFPSLDIYGKFCRGEITGKEYSDVKLAPVVTLIYEDEIKLNGE